MGKPHKHAELIKAWADGAEIEYKNHKGQWEGYLKGDNPSWDDGIEYRIKPEPEYPASSLSYSDLCDLVNVGLLDHKHSNSNEGYQTFLARLVANAAVKRYIQDQEKQNV